ncbi:MAG: cobalt transporter CbiM [Lachnospiraceae bacterium]|nr:cobalt transporter CbiM [Lachnospiraceae bacterium]
MHIPENYLSPATCAVMTVAMVPVWTHALKRVKLDLPKEKIPFIGVGAAFSFLGMMFNVPLPGGTTGHAVGGTLIALLFGPDAACLAVSVALLIQALIFGDGGVLAFGANCFNMAFILPYVGYALYQMLRKVTGNRTAAAAIGSYLGINAAAFCAAVEFGIQPLLFRDAAGNALYCPYDLSVSIPAMMIPHLIAAGLVEAVFTVAVFAFVRATSPDLIYEETAAEAKKGHIPVFALIAGLIAATPLGLLATGTAWGEWGADEIAEVETAGKALGYTPAGLENGWSLSVFMPDYAFDGIGEVPAYLLSAVIGVALLIIVFKVLSYVIGSRAEQHAA